MAFTPNVVDGNIILAAWGNEIRDRSLQVFATVAERDAQWVAPPNGAHCMTLDTATIWQRAGGSWLAYIVRAAGGMSTPMQLVGQKLSLTTAANGTATWFLPVAMPLAIDSVTAVNANPSVIADMYCNVSAVNSTAVSFLFTRGTGAPVASFGVIFYAMAIGH